MGLIMAACSEAEFSAISSDLTNKGAGDSGPLVHEIPQEDLDEALSAYPCRNPRPHKVAICHYPPGNIAAAHTICISRNALPAHIGRHGNHGHYDRLGACNGDPYEEDIEDESNL